MQKSLADDLLSEHVQYFLCARLIAFVYSLLALDLGIHVQSLCARLDTHCVRTFGHSLCTCLDTHCGHAQTLIVGTSQDNYFEWKSLYKQALAIKGLEYLSTAAPLINLIESTGYR